MMDISTYLLLICGILLPLLSASVDGEKEEEFFMKDSSLFSGLDLPVVNPALAAYTPLPLPVEGKCVAGSRWTINNVFDLYHLIDQLECMWTASVVPQRVPLGQNYGRLLAFTNTAALDLFTDFLPPRPYQGDYTFLTQCKGQLYIIGELNFGGLGVSWGVWTINSFPRPLVEGEFYDGREGVLMDFSVDMDRICPIEGHESLLEKNYRFRPFKTGRYPMRLFIDLLRVVGCDSDGGKLLLGRTFMLDPDESNHTPAFTVLFFVLKSLDPGVAPNFKCGTEIQLTEGYEYSRHGALEFLERQRPSKWIEAKIKGTLPDGMYDYENFLNKDGSFPFNPLADDNDNDAPSSPPPH